MHPDEVQASGLLLEFIDDLEVLLTATVWHYRDTISDYVKGIQNRSDGVDPDVEFCAECQSMAIKRTGFPRAIWHELFCGFEEDWGEAARSGGCGCDCMKRSRRRSRRRCQGQEQ